MMIVERDGKQHIVLRCQLCAGEGIVAKCYEPEKHNEDHDSAGYKDSFEKQEETHKAVLQVCGDCAGIGVVLVPLERILVLKEKVDSTSENPGSDDQAPDQP